MTNPQALREALPSSAGWVAFDLDECTVTIAVDSADEVRAVRDALPSRNRVRVFDATTVATAVTQGDARGIVEQCAVIAENGHRGDEIAKALRAKASEIIAALPAVTELDERNEAMVCTGCGTTKTVAFIKASSATAFTCCPERKMIPVRTALAALPKAGEVDEKAQIIAWLYDQSDKGADLGIASDKGTTRRAAYGGGSLALKRAAEAIQAGDHLRATPLSVMPAPADGMREAQIKTVAEKLAAFTGAPYEDWRHFTVEAGHILDRLAALHGDQEG